VKAECAKRAASAERQAFTWASLKPGIGTTAAGHSSVQRASFGDSAILTAIHRGAVRSYQIDLDQSDEKSARAVTRLALK
jgi:hypothetical protein